MKQPKKYSDEFLNAYIDGEITIEEEMSLLESMQNDMDLAKRVNELKRIKLLVSTTYSGNKANQKSVKNKWNIPLSYAASVLLIIGVISGWASHEMYSNDNTLLTKSNENKTWNIVLHVNSNDKYIQQTILDETESLLESFKDSNENVKVEIVAYGKGVFLFDSEKSKYKSRLSTMKNNFSNLSYAVCGRTVKRLEKIQGREIKLISNMTVARSGIYQIIKRQKQGWNYIRI